MRKHNVLTNDKEAEFMEVFHCEKHSMSLHQDQSNILFS